MSVYCALHFPLVLQKPETSSFLKCWIQLVSDYINPYSSIRAGALTQNSQLLVLCVV